MAKNLTNKQKQALRKAIKKEIREGTFIISEFANRYHSCKTTIQRLINRDINLQNGYIKYQNRQATKTKKGVKTQNEIPFVEEVSKNFNEEKGTGTITTRSLDIKTVEDLLRISEVNMTVWEVERHLINSWEVTVGDRKSVV